MAQVGSRLRIASCLANVHWPLGDLSMNWRTRTVRRIWSCDGQTMTEYALILATIAVVVVSLYQTSGTIVGSLLSSIDGSL
jgi:Flp pilus assembly pilin Flp